MEWIVSHTSVTDRQYRNDWVAVMPYKRVTRSIEIIGTKRGYYNIEEVRLVTTDILFRERLNKTISNDTELYVYPSRSQFMRLPEIFCQMYGESLLNRQLQEDSMEFMGIRDYVQTDSMRKINWKATARTGSLKVNQYHDSISQRLTIFVNVSQTGILRYYDLIEESIRISRNFIEEFVQKEIEEMVVLSASERIDGVIAKVYNMSRSQSIDHFRAKKVYVNSRLCENNSYQLKQQDVVSVRGYGKFVYNGVGYQTKKGKLSVKVGIYK